MSTPAIMVGDRRVGHNEPCFIIAEAGVNHNGDLSLARKLVDAAVEAGADAVKFQTFRAARLVTAQAPKAGYQQRGEQDRETQHEMLARLELSESAHHELQEYCGKRGIFFISSPFDEQSAEFLADLGVPLFKIPSGEIVNPGYLSFIARFGRPMVVSTGMSTLGEVEAAVRAIEAGGNRQFILLHCVSNYPASPEDANLRAMATMAAAFGAPVGYSDHTLGIEVSLAAVALGACVIEKHLTLDRTLPGPDHAASSPPEEFRRLVCGIRTVEAALGTGRKEPTARELETASVARKSLVAARDLPEGCTLTEPMVALRRPGTGLPPAWRPLLVGRTVVRDVEAGTLLSLDMLR